MPPNTAQEPTRSLGMDCPDLAIEPTQEQGARNPLPTPHVGFGLRRNAVLECAVGSELHGVVITAADHDIEAGILDCARRSMDEEAQHNTAAALRWTAIMQIVLRSRRPEVVKALETVDAERAQKARDTDAGSAWFQTDEAQAMGKPR